jgi:hypothetical protein
VQDVGRTPNLYYLPLVRRDDGVLSPSEIACIHSSDLALVSELSDFITANYEKLKDVVDINGRLHKTDVFRPKLGDDYWYTIVDDSGTPVPAEDARTVPTAKDLEILREEIRRLEYSEALSPQESISIYGAFIEPEFEEIDHNGFSGERISWNALAAMPRVIVIGAPGAGKTTTLRRLVLQHLEQWEADRDRPFPVYIQMRHVHEGGAIERSFRRYLPDNRSEVYERDNQLILKNMRISLILDGLDEISELTRAETIKTISQLAGENQILSIIASTREAGYFWQFDSFKYVRILPLTQNKVREWSFYRFGGGDEWLSFITSFEERRELQALAGNPLLLSIATSLYRRSSALPQNKSTLFKSYFDALIEQWDSVRGVVRQRESWAAPARKSSALCRAAYFGRVTGMESFTEDEFIEWNYDLNEGNQLLLVCERDTGVVTQGPSGRWYFIHRMFSDYLAARYMIDYKGYTVDAFDPFFKSEDWLDIWSFACGIAPNADDLVRMILRNRLVPKDKKLDALAAAFEQDIVVSLGIADDCASFFRKCIEGLFVDKLEIKEKSWLRLGARWSVFCDREDVLVTEARALLRSLQRLRKSRMGERIVSLLSKSQGDKSRRLIEMLRTTDIVTLSSTAPTGGQVSMMVTLNDELGNKAKKSARGVGSQDRAWPDAHRALMVTCTNAVSLEELHGLVQLEAHFTDHSGVGDIDVNCDISFGRASIAAGVGLLEIAIKRASIRVELENAAIVLGSQLKLPVDYRQCNEPAGGKVPDEGMSRLARAHREGVRSGRRKKSDPTIYVVAPIEVGTFQIGDARYGDPRHQHGYLFGSYLGGGAGTGPLCVLQSLNPSDPVRVTIAVTVSLGDVQVSRGYGIKKGSKHQTKQHLALIHQLLDRATTDRRRSAGTVKGQWVVAEKAYEICFEAT